MWGHEEWSNMVATQVGSFGSGKCGESKNKALKRPLKEWQPQTGDSVRGEGSKDLQTNYKTGIQANPGFQYDITFVYNELNSEPLDLGETNKFLKLVAEMKAIQKAISTPGNHLAKTDRESWIVKSPRARIMRSIEGCRKELSSSISTPDGPTSTSLAPSSTPLGLGNCYTLTFDPKTSQSGEQDDNDSDDGNCEYDVDIYDDE
ncbi:hypothetical protein Tco_1367814 [Tanacetum coccineum]